MALRAIHAIDGASHGLQIKEGARYNELQAKLAAIFRITPASLIVMHTEGWQVDNGTLSALTEEAKREEGKGRPVDVYCFDRNHLDADVDELADEFGSLSASHYLAEAPLPLWSLYEPSDKNNSKVQELIQRHRKAARHYQNVARELLTSLHLQRTALGIALSNLSRHRAGKQETVDAFELFAAPLLSNYAKLLSDFDFTIDLVKRVQVHPQTAPVNPQRNSKDKEKTSRYLSDFINIDRLNAVKATCQRTFGEMQDRSEELRGMLRAVAEDTAHLEDEYNHDYFEDIEDCERDVGDVEAHTHELMDNFESSESTKDLNASTEHDDVAALFAELASIETDCRERTLFLVARRNASTRKAVETLQHIAGLQHDLSNTFIVMDGLDNDLRSRCDGFKHLARLQVMVPAYAATVGEIVRRHLHSQSLLANSSTFANSISKLVTTENKIRTTYRSEYSGQLPWEIRGLDEASENVEVDVRRPARHDNTSELPILTQRDLAEFQESLQTLEADFHQQHTSDVKDVPAPLRQAILAIRQADERINTMQRNFKQMLLDTEDADSATDTNDVNGDVRQLEEANVTLQRELQSERSLRETQEAEMAAQIATQTVENVKLLEETVRIKSLAGKIQAAVAETSTSPRASLNFETLPGAITALKEERDQARHQATEEAKIGQERAKEHAAALSEVQANLESSRAALIALQNDQQSVTARHRKEVTKLQEDHSEFADARAKENDQLREEIELLQSENATLQATQLRHQRELSDYSKEQKRITSDLNASRGEAEQLRLRLADAENRIRSHTEEASQSTADIQRKTSSLQTNLSTVTQRLSAAQATALDAERRVQQLQRELDTTRTEKSKLEAQAQTSTEAPALSQETTALLKSLLTEIVQAFKIWQQAISIVADNPDKLSLECEKMSDIALDTPDDLQSVTKAVSADANALGAAHTAAAEQHVTSAKALITRWQKECKIYRSRSKLAADKIAFRNFKEGDLALFLPTRNTSAQVWAAFNAGFPHYFLNATGNLMDQTKTREWLVARIISITEHTVDPKKPESNPYSLASGVKYWTLDTEMFTPQGPSYSSRTVKRDPASPVIPRRHSSAMSPIQRTVEDVQASAQSKNTNTEELNQSTFSIVHTPMAQRDQIFGDPESPFTPHYNIEAPMLSPTLTRSEGNHKDSNNGELDSSAPAFLPASNGKVRQRPALSTSGSNSSRPTSYFSAKRSNSGPGPLYVRKKAALNAGAGPTDPNTPFKANTKGSRPTSPASSAAFTYASVGSLATNPNRTLDVKQRRESVGASSGKSSADFPTSNSLKKATSTLSQSFVSSLGRHAGQTIKDDETLTPRQLNNLRAQSSSSMDLLRRFSRTVENTTGASVKGVSQLGSS